MAFGQKRKELFLSHKNLFVYFKEIIIQNYEIEPGHYSTFYGVAFWTFYIANHLFTNYCDSSPQYRFYYCR